MVLLDALFVQQIKMGIEYDNFFAMRIDLTMQNTALFQAIDCNIDIVLGV